ncbi:MAG: hypothetical protein KAR54_03375, partial [Candidatus Pacebacteria bacterium]|nr:hypothetical protein [Candidatus Paceibacterota bacterium]
LRKTYYPVNVLICPKSRVIIYPWDQDISIHAHNTHHLQSRTGRIGNPGHQVQAQGFCIFIDLMGIWILFRRMILF